MALRAWGGGRTGDWRSQEGALRAFGWIWSAVLGTALDFVAGRASSRLLGLRRCWLCRVTFGLLGLHGGHAPRS